MVYAEAPWTFKGRALYQLQLVKADEARKHIPAELQLVEFCGYTLGGVYLARYDDSPAGVFDECVAMAGLVWNPPTSCAWAARVYVSSREARDHGVKSVGLPSRLASFPLLSQPAGSSSAWWGRAAAPAAGSSSRAPSSSSSSGEEVVALLNVDRRSRGLPQRPVAVFRLPAVAASGFLGPRLRLSLPSFSGGTLEHPGLLQYSCDLQTSVMPVAPMRIQLPHSHEWQQQQQHKHSQQSMQQPKQQQQQQQHPEVLDLLLGGKPLVCLAFSDMEMHVKEPQRLAPPAPAAPSRQPATVPALAAMLPWAK
ncbi:hypothetical protein COO60DRAFT_1703985 [Scenedesmus sp. NREL 46B-D3]|nr:hypothetical protein COO60DRAFT_1703985 [Scenedesmus sp. NREL 46B-D3]